MGQPGITRPSGKRTFCIVTPRNGWSSTTSLSSTSQLSSAINCFPSDQHSLTTTIPDLPKSKMASLFASQVGFDHLWVLAYFGGRALRDEIAEVEHSYAVAKGHHKAHIVLDN